MGLILTLVFLVLDYAIDREMYARLDHFLNIRASALALQLQVRTPEQAAKAHASGAYAVVVGSAITRPEYVTSWFRSALDTAIAGRGA